MVLFNNPIDRQQVATLARRIYPSTSAVFMKQFARATSYPYGHLVIDLKSDTPEKDRLHSEIFDTAKTMDEKMTVEKGIIGTQYEEEEEDESGGLRRRSEEEEEEEVDTSVTKLDLSPGRRECQKLKEHTICLANRPGRNGCFLRQLIADSLHRWIIPQTEAEAEESNPDMDPEEALEVITRVTLERIGEISAHIDLLFGKMSSLHIQMSTAKRLHLNSHLSVPLAITEAIRLYKLELNKALVNRKPKDKAKMMSPITPETHLIQGPNDPYQKTKTAKMEDLSESE